MVGEAGPVRITQQEILEFANRYDPQWFHTDVEASVKGPYGGLIASGWQTCGLAMRLSVDHFLKTQSLLVPPAFPILNGLHRCGRTTNSH